MSIVTAQSRTRLPFQGGFVDGPSRPRAVRRRHGRGPASVADVALLTIAIASIIASRGWSLLGPGPWSRTVAAASILGAAAIGYVGVLAWSGVVHLPGTRTASSLTTRVVTFVTGAQPAHVPLPSAPSKLVPNAPVFRQVAPDLRGGELGPSDPGNPQQGASDQAPPVDPRATSTAVVQTPTPPVELPPPPSSARISAVKHVWQTWNNCGPATVTMALSAIGKAESQAAAVAFLKTSSGDKNVNPNELVDYVRSRGAKSEWHTGGDMQTLKRLIGLGVPVIVEVGFEYEPGDWMGHYRLIVGYDDSTGKFIAYDSYLAPGINVPQPYDSFDANWRAFNRTFLPIYLPNQAAAVAAVAGEVDDPANLDRALTRAMADADANPTLAFAWFNVGTSLVALGRMDEAADAFDVARRLKLPWRMLWYQFGPFEAYLNVNRLDDVLLLANANIANFSELEESHYYKGRALQAQGNYRAARVEYGLALKANNRYVPARHFLSTLPPM